MLPFRKFMFMFFRTQLPTFEIWIKNKLVNNNIFRYLCFAFRDNLNHLTQVKDSLNKELYSIMKINAKDGKVFSNTNNLPYLKKIIQRLLK